RTLGVGYENIDALVQGHFGLKVLLVFGGLKFLSWVIALGSGTSGGTLAPLFMIGGSLAAVISIGMGHLAPWFGIDPRIAALVGMAAIFAGSSRALLTAVVFCFETTRHASCLLPLLGGGIAAYLISALMMRNTIMTEKIARRGVRVPSEYTADYLQQVAVGAAMSREVVSLKSSDELDDVRRWLVRGEEAAQHQGYPVLDDAGHVRGVITRRHLLDPNVPGIRRIGDMIKRPPIVVYETHSLREAADHMVDGDVGRLVVVSRDPPYEVRGMLTRGDILSAHRQRLHEASDANRRIRWRKMLHRGSPGAAP
ncbi:MAG: chloride channel protein, partial [Xanthomonadales bacterium]|nr:chloride channel protein [Xanthomonadales bacterium]